MLFFKKKKNSTTKRKTATLRHQIINTTTTTKQHNQHHHHHQIHHQIHHNDKQQQLLLLQKIAEAYFSIKNYNTKEPHSTPVFMEGPPFKLWTTFDPPAGGACAHSGPPTTFSRSPAAGRLAPATTMVNGSPETGGFGTQYENTGRAGNAK
jgi:hypothetical protein